MHAWWHLCIIPHKLASSISEAICNQENQIGTDGKEPFGKILVTSVGMTSPSAWKMLTSWKSDFLIFWHKIQSQSSFVSSFDLFDTCIWCQQNHSSHPLRLSPSLKTSEREVRGNVSVTSVTHFDPQATSRPYSGPTCTRQWRLFGPDVCMNWWPWISLFDQMLSTFHLYRQC